jgi:hypothetical protein
MELQALHSLVLSFSMLDRQQPHAWDFADGLQLRVKKKKKNLDQANSRRMAEVVTHLGLPVRGRRPVL